MTDTQAPDVVVTEADREAASDFQAAIGRPARYVREMRAGEHDHGPTCQAFARHRLSTQSARIEELEAALREIAVPVPAEFEARGDTKSGRVSKFYKAGRFDHAQALARATLSNIGDSNDG